MRTILHARYDGRRGGFTMVELIVVIGIIILAAGMMTPQITDFFKGRRLRQLSNEVRSAINSARLKAVNERTQVRLVFFREGIRVFDEREGRFIDDLFNPETSDFAGDQAWYVLGFYRDTPSVNLRKFREWEEENRPARARGEKQAPGTTSNAPVQYSLAQLAGLPQIIFLRDGTVEFNVGTDVSSIFFKKDPPEKADLVIYVANNTSACFIDIQLTGQNRSKQVALEAVPEKPLEKGSPGDSEKQSSEKTRRRSRRG